MKVNFLIAGVQKGGTSALHHFLSQHPSIILPKQKEIHFFDNEKIDWAAPPYEHYHSHFPSIRDEVIIGEATPIYTYWRPALARIHRYNPNMKLIVILRDPVARAYSHWRMETIRQAETLSFSQAIREGRKRVREKAETLGCHRVYSYVERGFYLEQVLRLHATFPKENLLFLATADLRKNHTAVLDRICRFLGVPSFTTYPENQTIFSHATSQLPPPSSEDIAYLRALFSEDLRETETITGLDIEREVGEKELADRTK